MSDSRLSGILVEQSRLLTKFCLPLLNELRLSGIWTPWNRPLAAVRRASGLDAVPFRPTCPTSPSTSSPASVLLFAFPFLSLVVPLVSRLARLDACLFWQRLPSDLRPLNAGTGGSGGDDPRAAEAGRVPSSGTGADFLGLRKAGLGLFGEVELRKAVGSCGARAEVEANGWTEEVAGLSDWWVSLGDMLAGDEKEPLA